MAFLEYEMYDENALTPDDAFDFFVRDNGCSVKSLRDETCIEIKIPEYYHGKPVTGIGDSAFRNCISLTSVIIPDGVATIGDHAFEGCTELTSVTIPDSVTAIGEEAFSGCEFLTSVTMPNSVTIIGAHVFHLCTNLKTIICSGDYDTLKGVFVQNNPSDENVLACIEQGAREKLQHVKK